MQTTCKSINNSLESVLEELEVYEEYKENNEVIEYPPNLSSLIDDTYNEQIYSIIFKELILKMLETLPSDQKELLMLHYGFVDNKCYSLKEIADRFKLTHQRISSLKEEALNNLKNPIRAKYFQYIINNYTTAIYPHMQDNIKEEVSKKIHKKKLRYLEEFLIRFINKEDIIEAVKDMPSIYKEFSILLFGLIDDITYTRKEITEKMNLTESKYTRLKEKIITKIITFLRIKYSPVERIISEEELLDYLMINYLNSKKSKKLERK